MACSSSSDGPATTAPPASTTAAPITTADGSSDEGTAAGARPTTATAPQAIGPGFGYVTTRDGTTLSVNVMLPGAPESGPYPTVIEYSGYDPSNPDNTTFGQLFNTLGYAYVGINMRGTGCSGGSFVFFEDRQLTDGYDAIEAIAGQTWVLHNKVGMVGISYPGITQLFVASTRPPSLAAITPLSVFDDAYRGVLYPGGMLNTGFAASWADQRAADAEPFGQAWTRTRVDAGDTECDANQRERTTNQDLRNEILANPYYDPALADRINPSLLVDEINVPVFLAGAWQDEQTGGRFPALINRFTSAPSVYVTLTNGLHTESLGLGVFSRLYEFLDLYVARRTPTISGLAAFIPSIAYQQLFGVDGVEWPPMRFQGKTYEEALTQFESEPRVRILFEEGAADGLEPGAPVARFEQAFDTWPLPGTTPTPLRLSPEGSISYTYDPDAVADTFYGGDLAAIWQADVTWDWRQPPAEHVVAFLGPKLAEDTVMVGPASADLWITSTAADTDLEVTVTEVRPDGSEVYVQSGWLRASQRALDASASTPLRPVITQLASDAAPLTPDEATLVRVEVFPFAHVFRAGSRVRVVVGSPGGNRAQWAFQNLPAGGTVTVLTDDQHPSQVVLPVVPGIAVPAGSPACGSLRGQPCRTYQKLG